LTQIHPQTFAQLSSFSQWTAVFLGLLIIGGSLYPLAHLPGPTGSDKLLHLLAYGTWAFFIPLALVGRVSLQRVVLASMLSLSGLIELIQPYVNRHGEWSDWLVNGAGILLGASVGSVLERRWRPSPYPS